MIAQQFHFYADTVFVSDKIAAMAILINLMWYLVLQRFAFCCYNNIME